MFYALEEQTEQGWQSSGFTSTDYDKMLRKAQALSHGTQQNYRVVAIVWEAFS